MRTRQFYMQASAVLHRAGQVHLMTFVSSDSKTFHLLSHFDKYEELADELIASIRAISAQFAVMVQISETVCTENPLHECVVVTLQTRSGCWMAKGNIQRDLDGVAMELGPCEMTWFDKGASNYVCLF